MLRLFLAEALVIGAVGWAVVSVDSALAGGGCRGEPVTTERTTTVETGEMPCFTPTVIEIEMGDTVTWRNTGSMLHNVVGANAAWGEYEEIAPGRSTSHMFAEAGLFPYVCMLHPGMIGTVVVGVGGGESSVSLAGSGGDAARAATAPQVHQANLPGALLAGAGAAGVVAGVGGYGFGRRRGS